MLNTLSKGFSLFRNARSIAQQKILVPFCCREDNAGVEGIEEARGDEKFEC